MNIKIFEQTLRPAITMTLIMTLTACGGGGGGSGSSSGSNAGNSGNNGSSGNDIVTISGQAQGIANGQLSVSNSGTNKTQLSSDGSFSFSVTTGSNYDIVIDSNPLEQLCSVENGSGNAKQNINNIQINCQAVTEASHCSGNTDSDDDQLSDCQELEIYKTNPWLADTDGDNLLDGREAVDFDPDNNRYIFNPRVADMATISVDLTAVPEIDLDFTKSSGGSRNVSTTYEQSETQSIHRDWGGEVSRQLEVGHTYSIATTQTVGTEVNVSLTDLGGSTSYESSLTVGFENSVTQTRGSSVNWSKSATQENTRAYAETVDLTEEQSSTYNGGFLRVTARVRNEGHIPYDLENLTLSAVLFDPSRPFDIQSIGTMEFSDGGFPRTTILKGESAPLNFSTPLTLAKAQRLLKDSQNIVVTPGTYRLLDIDDQSILLVDRDVSARTATIIVDYGIDAAREEKFRIAVNQGNGQRSINVANALQNVLGLSISQGMGQWTYGNDDSPSVTPSGLLSLGDYAMDNSTNRYWLLAHNRNNDNGAGERITDYYHILQEGYDLNNILLRAGDQLTLVYVGDRDRDGISDRMEKELGTDRELLDTDGDTLGDGLEVYGWLTNLNKTPCNEGDNLTRVYANPLLMDSDEDGIEDAQERDHCDNPSFNFVAEAGAEQIVDTNSSVTLFGNIEGITDTPPVYHWTLVSGPNVIDANGASVRELEGRQPKFTAPDEVSTLVWELQATINGETQSDRTHIQVQKDRNFAVYVGTPSENVIADGTREAPFGSLSEALASLTAGEDLYVMTQTEPYTLVNTLSIPDGTSVFGGYDNNWIRNVETNRTPIVLNTQLAIPAVSFTEVSEAMWFSGFAVRTDGTEGTSSNNVVTLDINTRAANSGPLHIVDNRLEASDVPMGTATNPGSSYAMRVSGLQILRLFDNHLIAGQGSFGAGGAAGERGDNGNDASGRSGASGKGGLNGGRGGDWGRGPAGGGGNGSDGQDSGSIQGGKGGKGAGGCKNATDSGNRGGDGAVGTDGKGALSPSYASLTSNYSHSAGSHGQLGSHGAGGGGGGGGGGCGTAGGGTGGGGGEGGERGTSGKGGSGGGASIGLWLYDVATAEIRDNTIETNNGGNAGSGGRGGNGGSGGDGAKGGSPGENCFLGLCDRGGSGASGGDGGHGGRGGHGGGGAGGPSFGIYVSPEVAPLLFNNTITTGDGGAGGFSWMHGGNGGDSYAVFDADITDGKLPEIGPGNALNGGTAGNGGSTVSGGTAGDTGWSGETNF